MISELYVISFQLIIIISDEINVTRCNIKKLLCHESLPVICRRLRLLIHLYVDRTVFGLKFLRVAEARKHRSSRWILVGVMYNSRDIRYLLSISGQYPPSFIYVIYFRLMAAILDLRHTHRHRTAFARGYPSEVC